MLRPYGPKERPDVQNIQVSIYVVGACRPRCLLVGVVVKAQADLEGTNSKRMADGLSAASASTSASASLNLLQHCRLIPANQHQAERTTFVFLLFSAVLSGRRGPVLHCGFDSASTRAPLSHLPRCSVFARHESDPINRSEISRLPTWFAGLLAG